MPAPGSAPSGRPSWPRIGAVSVTRHDGMAASSDSPEAATSRAERDRGIGQYATDPAIGPDGVTGQHGVVVHGKGGA